MSTYRPLPNIENSAQLTVQEQNDVLELARRVKAGHVSEGKIQMHGREKCLIVAWREEGKKKCK